MRILCAYKLFLYFFYAILYLKGWHMNMKVNTNISIDSELKKKAVVLFKEFGLDLSTAVTLFLSQSVREKRIPFEIKLEIPNQTTINAYKEIEEMETNPSDCKTFSSLDSLMEDLLN